ncbi:hypothetical protein Ancab_000252 [Ancistrocladus abbreviatus]
MANSKSTSGLLTLARGFHHQMHNDGRRKVYYASEIDLVWPELAGFFNGIREAYEFMRDRASRSLTDFQNALKLNYGSQSSDTWHLMKEWARRTRSSNELGMIAADAKMEARALGMESCSLVSGKGKVNAVTHFLTNLALSLYDEIIWLKGVY